MAVFFPHGYNSFNLDAIQSFISFMVREVMKLRGLIAVVYPNNGSSYLQYGTCEPMIVVMPNGNVELAAAPEKILTIRMFNLLATMFLDVW